MATVSLLILPIAIVKYAMSGNSWLAGYYLFLCGLILFDLRAYLSGKRLPINAAILLIVVQIGDLILIRHHGTSAAFGCFRSPWPSSFTVRSGWQPASGWSPWCLALS
ncbi:hypothetical protein [uncultured Celeribacter sp.]|uniref:hypothetical protein n=1 Tax=uncultured Celeribacter sp. TaxID=1303376 RepID=UPI002AA8A288|nr:hypothetical protein [uncultured Celeribacter sp.]